MISQQTGLRVTLIVSVFVASLGGLTAQQDSENGGTLGILLDTSVEMGFLIPQARKEIRLLNENLAKAGREPVLFKEVEGASIDRAGSIAVPGRRNIYHVIKNLIDESDVDTIYWITALQGMQSGEGIFMLSQLFEEERSRPRRLVIRNVWQEQLQGGETWLYEPPDSEVDPLGADSIPDDWYLLAEGTNGVVQRSWAVPPRRFIPQFGFPKEIVSRRFMQLSGSPEGRGVFDTGWASEFHASCGLHPMRQDEMWQPRITGRRWMTESSLVPFLDAESLEERTEAVFEMMCKRESIEEDLSTIEAEKIGVLFGMGYVGRDLGRVKGAQERSRPIIGHAMEFVADTAEVVKEIRQHEAEHVKRAGRVYHTEFVELVNTRLPQDRDPFAMQMARLVKNEEVDAIYFFTNGYRGGGDYGTCAFDYELMAQAIQKAGTPLYVRIPFEFGPVPFALQKLAFASGGGVFFGEQDDPDWEIKLPEEAWPQGEE